MNFKRKLSFGFLSYVFFFLSVYRVVLNACASSDIIAFLPLFSLRLSPVSSPLRGSLIASHWRENTRILFLL